MTIRHHLLDIRIGALCLPGFVSARKPLYCQNHVVRVRTKNFPGFKKRKFSYNHNPSKIEPSTTLKSTAHFRTYKHVLVQVNIPGAAFTPRFHWDLRGHVTATIQLQFYPMLLFQLTSPWHISAASQKQLFALWIKHAKSTFGERGPQSRQAAQS